MNIRGHILSLGLKGGIRTFSLDWSKGRFRDPDAVFNQNLDNELFPTLGAGAFYFTHNAYFGISTPNVLTREHYDEIAEAQAAEEIHLYAIGGYVIDLNEDVKLKPAFFMKYVAGSPFSWDVSASVLFREKFSLGVNYRWDDSVSAMAGFQISPRLSIGYAYDYNVSELNSYNSGSHEVFLRYDWLPENLKIKSPRFF